MAEAKDRAGREGKNSGSAHANEAGLPPLPGLDVDTALDRLAGNIRLYKKTLCMLLDLGPKHEAEIDDALARRNWHDLHRAVHTVKGLAGTLGAVALHAEAVELEKILKSPEENWDVAGSDSLKLKASLSGVTSMIAATGMCVVPAVPRQERPAPESSRKEQRREELLASLTVLLEESDSAAPRFFQENLAGFRAVLPMGVLKALDSSLNSFNYAAALAVIRRMDEDAS